MSSPNERLESATVAYETAMSRPGPKPGLTAYFDDHGLTPEIAAKYRLGYVEAPQPGHENFAGRLAIPYLTRTSVWSLKFRRLTGDGPKYLYEPGTTPTLFNITASLAPGVTVGLAEGEIDAIVATERLGVPTMGVPGVDTWKGFADLVKPLFKNFRRVIVFADGDAVNSNTGKRPGEELARAITETLGWRAQVIRHPEGEDVSSMVAKGRLDFYEGKL